MKTSTDQPLLASGLTSLFLCNTSTTSSEIAPICATLFSGDDDDARTSFVSAIGTHLSTRRREIDSILAVTRNQRAVDTLLLQRPSKLWEEGTSLLNPGGRWLRGGFWVPGKYRLILSQAQIEHPSTEFTGLLRDLRLVASKGAIRAVGRGAPAVGLTLRNELESLSTVARSNVEVSATRLGRGSNGKRSLFSRVPKWVEGNRTDFLNKHGSFDGNRRWSLNKSIYMHRVTAGGWQIAVNRTNAELELIRMGVVVAKWTLAELEEAFTKYHQRVFVYAEALGNEYEKFRYITAVHATGGTFTRYLRVLEDGGACFDLTLSRLPSGVARDHGFLFRIDEGELSRLFERLAVYDLTADG